MSDALPVPKNRREVLVWAFGAATVLGLGGISKVTGLTVESRELTDCRSGLAVCASERDGCIQSSKDDGDAYERRLERCWNMRRNMGDGPTETE